MPDPDPAIFTELELFSKNIQPTIAEKLPPEQAMLLVVELKLLPPILICAAPVIEIPVVSNLKVLLRIETVLLLPVADIAVFAGVVPEIR